MGENNMFREPFELIMIRGFRHFDVEHAWNHVVWPLMHLLLDLLLTPYIIARLLCFVLSSSKIITILRDIAGNSTWWSLCTSPVFQSRIMRYCFLYYIIFKIMLRILSHGIHTMKRTYTEIRDETLLVEVALTNTEH